MEHPLGEPSWPHPLLCPIPSSPMSPPSPSLLLPAVHLTAAPTGKGMVEFKHKKDAVQAVTAITDRFFVLSRNPKPVRAEFSDMVDVNMGLLEGDLTKYRLKEEEERRFPPRFVTHNQPGDDFRLARCAAPPCLFRAPISLPSCVVASSLTTQSGCAGQRPMPSASGLSPVSVRGRGRQGNLL